MNVYTVTVTGSDEAIAFFVDEDEALRYKESYMEYSGLHCVVGDEEVLVDKEILDSYEAGYEQGELDARGDTV